MKFISFRPNYQKAKEFYSDNDRVTIHCYLKTPGIKMQEAASTGISVPFSSWDQKSETINFKEAGKEFQKKSIKFDEIKKHFKNLDLFDKINPTQIPDKKRWLKHNILKATDPEEAEIKFPENKESISELFLDWAIQNENYRFKNGLVNNTTHYTTFHNRFKKFEAFRGAAVKLRDMNEDFESEILNYALDNFPAVATQQSFIKPINRVAKWILEKKPSARKQLQDNWVKITLPKQLKKNVPDKFTPTEKEIQDLKDYIPKDRWGKIVKEIYLFNAEYIGWRVSDFLRINPNKNIVEFQGYKFIGINPKKTETTSEEPVYAPISCEQEKTIKEIFPWPWATETESQISDSTRKFNYELKELFKLAGIDRVIKNSLKRQGAKKGKPIPRGDFKAYEIVSSHSGRRYRSNQLDGRINSALSKNIFGWGLESVTSKKHYLDPSLSKQKKLIKLHQNLIG